MPAPLDLRNTVPHSPRKMLGDFVHLARMTDKARAKGAGLLGEYLYPCPMDMLLLEFLGIDGETFLEVVQEREKDDDLLGWLKKNGHSHTSEEISRWNRTFLRRQPEDREGRERFTRRRNRIAPDRKDITTWVDLLDLDEGRDIPKRK
ncbi:MAG: DUF5069 domain-containing protein [Nitrospiria bacterium]